MQSARAVRIEKRRKIGWDCFGRCVCFLGVAGVAVRQGCSVCGSVGCRRQDEGSRKALEG